MVDTGQRRAGRGEKGAGWRHLARYGAAKPSIRISQTLPTHPPGALLPVAASHVQPGLGHTLHLQAGRGGGGDVSCVHVWEPRRPLLAGGGGGGGGGGGMPSAATHRHASRLAQADGNPYPGRVHEALAGRVLANTQQELVHGVLHARQLLGLGLSRVQADVTSAVTRAQNHGARWHTVESSNSPTTGLL